MSVQKNVRSLAGLALLLTLACVSLGCVRDSYQFGVGDASRGGLFSNGGLPGQAENRLAVGGHHPRIDAIESTVQAPGKWLKKVFRKPEIDPSQAEVDRQQAVAVAQEYLRANDLSDVNIDVRRYEPAEQWARLQANQRVAPLWKATGGTLSFLSYTLLPRRALHADDYDPFTNTLSLNSTRSTSALYEAAIAKQYRKQPMLGTYAMLQYVPLLPLIHHSQTTSDVLTYARVTEQTELEKELYPTTYARLGGAAVSETLSVTPLAAGTPFIVAPLMRAAGSTAGAISGQAVAKNGDKSNANRNQ